MKSPRTNMYDIQMTILERMVKLSMASTRTFARLPVQKDEGFLRRQKPFTVWFLFFSPDSSFHSPGVMLGALTMGEVKAVKAVAVSY